MHRVKKVSYPATYLSQGFTQLSHTGVTQLSHTGVTGNTTVKCRGNRGSHNCHTQGSQTFAQILHGEIKGVTQREENNKINIHRNVFPNGFVGVIAFAA